MAPEETLKVLSKAKVSVRVDARRLPIGHLDDEVKIARRLDEASCCGRAEEVEAFNAVPSAKLGEFVPFGLNEIYQRVHSTSLTEARFRRSHR